MRRNKGCLAVCLALRLSLACASGGAYEDGRAAYQSGAFRAAWEQLLPLAEQENTEAQCFLAAMCVNGQGRPADRTEGLQWYRRAARHGSALAWMNLGILARKDGDGAQTVACLAEAAATRGDAATILGEVYFYGDAGVAKDFASAARWFAVGAERGQSAARNSLGLLYEEGKGVPRDAAKALALYRQAAEGGDRRAEANLGRMYYEGRDVPHDLMAARTWLSLSARHGEATGEKLLREFVDKLTPEQIAETDRRAADMDQATKPAR